MSTLTARQARENARFPFDAFMYHERIGMVIAAIPKCGCSTVKRWLISVTDPAALAGPVLDVHRHAARTLALAKRPRDEAEAILAAQPLLVVVRDPVERLRSAFIDKFVRPAPDEVMPATTELIRDYRGDGVVADVWDERSITFRQFVEYVGHADPDHLDAHWRPQAAFVRGRRIDTLITLDRLSSTLDALAAALGRSDVRATPESVTRKELASLEGLADVSASELHARNLRPPLAQLADADVLKMIRERFAEDAALFARAQAE